MTWRNVLPTEQIEEDSAKAVDHAFWSDSSYIIQLKILEMARSQMNRRKKIHAIQIKKIKHLSLLVKPKSNMIYISG